MKLECSDIFERFIANFYRYEQRKFNVKSSEQLDWQFESLGGDLDLVPKQRTDITLSNNDDVKIIDTKYYRKPLVDSYYGHNKFISDHLRQITSYMMNMQDELTTEKNIHGILLYANAKGTKPLNEDFKWRNCKVSIKSINLDQSWQNIHNDLIKIIN